MIKLQSVGTALNPVNGRTYAMNNDNSIDFDSGGIHLSDCSEEWYGCLDVKDCKAILDVAEKLAPKTLEDVKMLLNRI